MGHLKTAIFALYFVMAISLSMAQDTLRVLPASGIPGTDSVSVNIALINSQPVLALQFDIKDSSNFLELSGIKETARTENFTLEATDFDTLCRIIIFDLLGSAIPEGKGTIAELYFDVSPQTNVSRIRLMLQNVTVSAIDAQPLDFVIDDTLFTVPSPVPVELANFSAKQAGNEIILTWRTLSESSNAGFEVQRRDEMNDFERIALVKGHGTTVIPHDYEYRDNICTESCIWYRLKQIDFNGSFCYSREIQIAPQLPGKFKLVQNYPNPVTRSESGLQTNFGVELPFRSDVTVSIYNVLGQRIRVIVQEELGAGLHSFQWDGKNEAGILVPAGMYLYRLQAKSSDGKRFFQSARKLAILP
ncbi:T9SS type A sorting domain-containing protein [candidate division KSB1 bacterium]|nr:T9SS type A sorting domain-containing protein [candidate division KSB1 bacterium]